MTVNPYQNMNSHLMKIGQLVKQSSGKGRKLVTEDVAETVNTYQDIISLLLKNWSAFQAIQQEGQKADCFGDCCDSKSDQDMN